MSNEITNKLVIAKKNESKNKKVINEDNFVVI